MMHVSRKPLACIAALSFAVLSFAAMSFAAMSFAAMSFADMSFADMSVGPGLALTSEALSQEGARPLFRDALAYEPSPAYPHGRPHPDAPDALSQFAFFIGVFDCLDRQRRGDGGWREFPAIWSGAYFMNGHGIQDKYWSEGFYTSNIRLFDERDGQWKVTYFSEPGYATGSWVGGASGDAIVLERETRNAEGATVLSRLTFSEMTPRGFEWRGARAIGGGEETVFWTSSCRRREGAPG